MSLVAGGQLTEAQRRLVLSVFLHRHYAIGPERYYRSEEAWLLDHAFHITRSGRLDRRYRYCEPACLANLEED